MNFKRYHESRNLFDKDNTTIYSAYFDASGSWLLSAESKSVKMPCQPNTQYTLSVPNSLVVFHVYESNNASIEPSSTSPPRATEITRGTNIGQYTFTTSSTAQIILFQGSNGAVTEWFNGLMLNTGSQPLPYEPYSSEVWHDIPHYIMGTSTDTITTLPAVLYLNDTTATVGLKGNTVQNGTPTPTTPIQPSECGERTGNLFDYKKLVPGYIYDSNGQMILDPNTESRERYAAVPLIEVEPGVTYLRTYNLSPLGNVINYYDSNKNFLERVTPGIGIPVTVPSDCNFVSFVIQTADFDVEKYMFTKGSTAPEAYVPYGYEISISSNSITTPVYLNEVETTRKIQKLVLTGSEDWILFNGDYFSTVIDSTSMQNTNCKCTHLVSTPTSGIYILSGSGRLKVFSNSVSGVATSLAEWKTYLQQQYTNDTPVTIWYVRSTPRTAVVNEPLRKIGDYADIVSDITIPTIAGANTIDIDTTLKPSEVTVTYKGWHPITDVHEAENGQWD